MKNFKRLISSMLVLLMTVMIFSGCTGGAKGPDTATGTTGKAPGETTAPATEKPQELVTLTAFLAKTWTTDVDISVYETNPLGKKLEQLTNVRVIMEYTTGSGAEVNDKLNLLLASSQYPDIINLNNMDITAKMVSDKIAIKLNDLIETKGNNIKEMYGDILDRIKFPDGGIYYLPNKYGYWEEGDPVPGFGNCYTIRKDVYEAVGSPKIETIDDIYNLLKLLQAKYDKNEKGEKIWVIGGFKQAWHNMRDVLADGAGFYAGGRFWIDPSGNLKYWVRSPAALTITKFYNRLTREGILDPESFTQDRNTFNTTKLNTARVLSFFGGWYMNWNTHLEYANAGMPNAENMVFLQIPFSVPGGDRPNFVEVNPLGSGQTVITDNCKNVEAAFKWLDTLASHDVNFEILNGIEGVMWEMKDGKPVMKQEYVDRFVAGEKDSAFMEISGYRLYDNFVAKNNGMTKWGTRWILKDDPVVMGDTRAAERDEKLGKYWYDSSLFNNLLVNSTDEMRQMYMAIDGKIMDLYYQAVLAKTEADCEKFWNEYVAELDKLGLKEIEEEMNKEYQKRIKK